MPRWIARPNPCGPGLRTGTSSSICCAVSLIICHVRSVEPSSTTRISCRTPWRRSSRWRCSMVEATHFSSFLAGMITESTLILSLMAQLLASGLCSKPARWCMLNSMQWGSVDYIQLWCESAEQSSEGRAEGNSRQCPTEETSPRSLALFIYSEVLPSRRRSGRMESRFRVVSCCCHGTSFVA